MHIFCTCFENEKWEWNHTPKFLTDSNCVSFFALFSDYSGFRVYIQVNEDGENPVSYLVDEASLIEVPDNPNWREDANKRIDQLGKNDVTVK